MTTDHPTEMRNRRSHVNRGTAVLLMTMMASLPQTTAQQEQPACIQLTDSTTCSAFSSAFVSTNKNVTDLFSFLTVVNDVKTFDSQLNQYISGEWRQRQYQTLLGCGAVDVSNEDLYARFSISVLCNGIVQNSIPYCTMPDDAKRPLCAADCADYAQSEEYVVANRNLCPTPGSNAQAQIRSDFEICALPADALSPANCVQATTNEPDNCGYGESLFGLCSYCASGGINSTDTCCYNSNAEKRCTGVVLPTIIPQNFTSATPTATSSATSTPAPGGSTRGLSGGAIAGIVIGSIAGAVLIALLLFFCIRRAQQKKERQAENIFNQPSPTRKGPQVTQVTAATPPQGYEVLPGGRIARMSALEGHSGSSPSRPGGSQHGSSPGTATGSAIVGGAAGAMAGRRRVDNQSSSDSFGESPGSETRIGVLRPPPTNIRRHGSLSSNSVLAGEDPNSPTSAGGMSSPPGINSQQSEQLPFFKDYYSRDDIRPGERVAVLWAYQPRANDEFSLERGDMLKVVGIWDDGWATGIMMNERADEWEARRQAQRDSGVANASDRMRDPSPPANSEIKAFPLVCVCLPDHWRKTIDGDGSTEAGSSAHLGIHRT
ncbi:putative SH3 domain-containing protein [Rosellinia necatrix]|uniref:Putative SH3 domain-containing protein n=1 Tax=Rosellinia necatrix TaxID=77044 RepID=A0A1W2TEE6_ROSNE|nr:putative SH3 domain-containing protein [Rosellinia necatrix]